MKGSVKRMAGKVIRELNVTKISYSKIVVKDGVPAFEPQPDAVFRSLMDDRKAEKALRKMLGPDVQIYISKVDSGRKRLAMSLEDFVSHATEVSADEPDDTGDDETDPETDGEEEGAPEPAAPAQEPAAPVAGPAMPPVPGVAIPGGMMPPGML